MKITGVRPLIVSPKAADIIALYEEMGFEKRHCKKGINEENLTSVTMKNAEGLPIVITQASKLPQDLTGISINVDNFEEACEYFKSKGCKDAQQGYVTETSTSKSTMFFAPSGFAISVTEHVKTK